MEKDGLVFYSVAMRGGDVQIDGQWAQSDFLATIAMYEYADGFEAKGPAAEECNASVLSLFGGRKVALTVPENAKLLVQKGEAVEAAYKIPAFTLLPISQGEPYCSAGCYRSSSGYPAGFQKEEIASIAWISACRCV